MNIPSTNVIRHWVAWSYQSDVPDEYIEHSIERAKQFEAWLYEERNRMAGVGAELERERIIKLLEEEGSTTFSLAYLIALIKGENK